MSKRLQVLDPEQGWRDIQRLAERDRLTMAEWARRALGDAGARRPVSEPEMKLKAVQGAAKYSFQPETSPEC